MPDSNIVIKLKTFEVWSSYQTQNNYGFDIFARTKYLGYDMVVATKPHPKR